MNAPSDSRPPEPGATSRSTLDWAREANLGPELARAIRTEIARRRRRTVGLSAVALCTLAAGLFVWRAPHAPAMGSASLEPSTAVIAPARQTLTDGSTVELKAGARLHVAYTAAERRVVLLHGEAHFQVAKGQPRPFIVAAEGVEVRAVGTEFTVGTGERTVEVLVTEGIVELNSRARSGPLPSETALGPQAMVAGERAVVPLDTPTPPELHAVSAAELAQRLAWRVPRLQFSGTPLAEVIALFRQHGGVQLRLGDAALGGVRVSGVLRADNSAALLRLLAADHDIVPEQRGEEIVLRRGP